MPAAWRKGTLLEEKASRHNFPPPSELHSILNELNAFCEEKFTELQRDFRASEA
jgi:hypothetical protein